MIPLRPVASCISPHHAHHLGLPISNRPPLGQPVLPLTHPQSAQLAAQYAIRDLTLCRATRENNRKTPLPFTAVHPISQETASFFLSPLLAYDTVARCHLSAYLSYLALYILKIVRSSFLLNYSLFFPPTHPQETVPSLHV